MGYTNEPTIALIAYSVSKEELQLLSSIYSSPVKYLYIGDGVSDEKKDWLLVKVSGNPVNRNRLKEFSNVNITITLPENYAITSI